MSNQEFETKRTALVNAFAAAGADWLGYMGMTDTVVAEIHDTQPQKYAVAGTLKGILSMAGKMMGEDGVTGLEGLHSYDEFGTKIYRAADVERLLAAPAAGEAGQLVAEARAVFGLMLEGCSLQCFGDYQNGLGEEIGPRMDALHEKLRAFPSSAAVPQPTGDLPPLPEYFGISEAEKERAHAYAVNYARAAIAAYLARQAKAEQPATGLESENELISMARMKQIRDGIRQQDGMDGDDWDFALANAVAASLERQAQGVPEGWVLAPKPRGRQSLAYLIQQASLACIENRVMEPDDRHEFAQYADLIRNSSESPAGAQNAEAIRNQALDFANEIINGALDGGDWCGGDVQELAAKHGLLKLETMVEPCGDECRCTQGVPFFPAECYRKTYIADLQTGSANTQEGGAFSSEESNELAAYGIDSRKLVKIGELPTQNACAYERDDGSNCECGWPKKTCRNYARAEKGQNNG